MERGEGGKGGGKGVEREMEGGEEVRGWRGERGEGGRGGGKGVEREREKGERT